MRIFTIGFTKKSAEDFFSRLLNSGVKRIIDVRLNNVSQLAGFSKKDDLKYFLRKICDVDYLHLLSLAPTQSMLDGYKKERGVWQNYEREFVSLITSREIEKTLSREVVADGCLLCSEDKPVRCHRRLVAEYLQNKWTDVEVEHL